MIGAAHGSLRSRLWPTRTFTAPRNRVGLGGHVGDGYVTLQRCARAKCALSVAYATGPGFTSPQPITTDGVLSKPDDVVAASGGRTRLKLLVWKTSRGALLAETLNSRTGRFDTPHQLSASSPPIWGRHLRDRTRRTGNHHLGQSRRHSQRRVLHALGSGADARPGNSLADHPRLPTRPATDPSMRQGCRANHSQKRVGSSVCS